MATDESDLEPIEPETACELFLDHKANNCADSKILVPRVRPEEQQRDETLDAERAQDILSTCPHSSTRRRSTC